VNVICVRGTKVTLEIEWKYLHVIYAVLSLVKQFVPSSNKQFYAIFYAVQEDLKAKVMLEAEAKRFHLCAKCFKEIDTEKDKYHHTQFESGYEVYSHQECPPTNMGKGYTQ